MDKKWVTAARDGVNKSYKPFPFFLGESALRIYHSLRMNKELLSPFFGPLVKEEYHATLSRWYYGFEPRRGRQKNLKPQVHFCYNIGTI